MTEKKKKEPANKHKVTDYWKEEVSQMCGFGFTHEQIARFMDIDVNTLKKHYMYELETGATKVVKKVAGVLFKKAVIDEDLGACIFYLKTRGRWRTADSDARIEENDKLMKEVKEIQRQLDKKHEKDY